jgi:hypothetical protein
MRSPAKFLLSPLVVLLSGGCWVAGSQGFAGTRSSGSGGVCLPAPELEARVAALREAMGVVDLTVHPGDAPTGIGLGVIDASCLTGEREGGRDAIIGRIQAAVSRASEQMQRCWDQYRVPVGPDVGAVLRRTRFLCQDPDGGGIVASMRRTTRTYDSCGRGLTRHTDGAYRRYQMTISAPRSGLPSKINQVASTELPLDEFASFLAHEAMHVLAMNNRDWHNSFDPAVRTATGCTSSLFEDRIYLTQAMCFPDSDYGRAFYGEGGASQCPEVCQRAVTEVDAEAALMYAASATPGSERTGSFGPSQVSIPASTREAELLCERARRDRGAALRAGDRASAPAVPTP